MAGYVVGMVMRHLPIDDLPTFSVALVLADTANQSGDKVFPSVALVSALSRVSLRQVQYSMRRLESSGCLIKVRPGGGRGRTTEYRFDLDWLLQQPDRMAELYAERDAKNGARPAPYFQTVHATKSNGAEKVHHQRENPAESMHCSAPEPVDPCIHTEQQVVGNSWSVLQSDSRPKAAHELHSLASRAAKRNKNTDSDQDLRVCREALSMAERCQLPDEEIAASIGACEWPREALQVLKQADATVRAREADRRHQLALDTAPFSPSEGGEEIAAGLRLQARVTEKRLARGRLPPD